MNPNFQNIGTAFVTAYYQAFDSCASGDERGAKISQFYHVSTHFCKGFTYVKYIHLWALRTLFIKFYVLREKISYQMKFSFVIDINFRVVPFPFLFYMTSFNDNCPENGCILNYFHQLNNIILIYSEGCFGMSFL